MSEKDKEGNSIKGNVIIKETKDSLIRSEDKLVVSLGLNNIIIIDTHDALLVANKYFSQSVKNLVSFMDDKGFNEGKNHKKVYRPCGSFLSIEEESSWQIKKVEVNPSASLSLQMHFHRSQHLVVVSGTAKIEIDNI